MQNNPGCGVVSEAFADGSVGRFSGECLRCRIVGGYPGHLQRSQHPLRDPPTMLVRLAEPPSVVGIGGGQTTDARLGVVAVVIAAWEEVFGISPGNSEGT